MTVATFGEVGYGVERISPSIDSDIISSISKGAIRRFGYALDGLPWIRVRFPESLGSPDHLELVFYDGETSRVSRVGGGG